MLGNPASYQPLVNFVEYPFADPGCDLATKVGDASGLELRIPLFGEPTTRDGRNALRHPARRSNHPAAARLCGALPSELRSRARQQRRRSASRVETSTYCGTDQTRFQDLIIEEERLQAYTTFWHAFSDHTEAFGELGYYRNENENRTSPSFPISRTSAGLVQHHPGARHPRGHPLGLPRLRRGRRRAGARPRSQQLRSSSAARWRPTRAPRPRSAASTPSAACSACAATSKRSARARCSRAGTGSWPAVHSTSEAISTRARSAARQTG